jgi:hypothetical protein
LPPLSFQSTAKAIGERIHKLPYRNAVHALNPDLTLDPTCVLPIETAATPPALLARSRARRRAALSPRDSSRPSPSLPCAPSARSCSRRRPLASSHLPRSIRSSCGENSESGEQIYGGAELHGVLLRGLLGARLRGHRAHAPPPGLRPRPQARHIHLRPRRQPLPGGQFLFSASSFLVVTFSAVTHVLFRPKKSYCPSSPRRVIKV